MIDESKPIEIGGRSYALEYDFTAFLELEKATGIAILRGGIRGADFESAPTFLAILHAGLRRHHPELTISELGRMIRPRDADRLQGVMVEALRLATGDEEPAEGGPDPEDPPTAQRSPGESSGP